MGIAKVIWRGLQIELRVMGVPKCISDDMFLELDFWLTDWHVLQMFTDFLSIKPINNS